MEPASGDHAAAMLHVGPTMNRSACLLLLVAGAALMQAQEVTYVSIPVGFDFPAKEAELLTAVTAGDVVRLRKHAWQVFAGLTQPAHPGAADGVAVWETWYSKDETFGPAAARGVRTIQRQLEVPAQSLLQSATAMPRTIGKSQVAVTRQPQSAPNAAQSAGQAHLSFTLFNEELRATTRASGLQFSTTLKRMNDTWPGRMPVSQRRITGYQPTAMSLKSAWVLVRKSGKTALPVWDGQARMALAPAQPRETWSRQVAIDPERDVIPMGETTDLPGFPGSRVVPLTAFHHFTLDAMVATRVSGAVPGDYMAMVGMHYTTREIPDWVWATLWWHDQPDSGPYAENRPAGDTLTGVWRNYLMDVAYDMEDPKESDGTPNAVFNPYLEARFANGVNSNCMTCHQRAVWHEATPRPSFLPVTRGAAPESDPLFVNGTQADFLWSLLLEAKNQSP